MADADEFGGLPDETGDDRRRGPRPRREWRAGPPSARSSWRWPWSAPRARREGVSQVENAVYSDAEGAARSPTRAASRPPTRATQAWAYASAFAGEGEDLMTGMGIGLGRDPGALDPEAIGAEAADRALGARGRPPAREPPLPGGARRVRGRLVRRLHRLDAVRRRRAARPLAVRGARGRGGGRARASCSSTTAADPDGPGARAVRRRGLAHPPHAADRGRQAAGYLYDARTARKDGRETTANAGRGSYRSPPSVGTTNLWSSRATPTLDELVARGRRRALRDRRRRPALRREPGVRHLLRGRLRAADRGRRAGRARCGRSRSPATSSRCCGRGRVGSESRWVPLGGSVKAAPMLVSEMAVSGK